MSDNEFEEPLEYINGCDLCERADVYMKVFEKEHGEGQVKFCFFTCFHCSPKQSILEKDNVEYELI